MTKKKILIAEDEQLLANVYSSKITKHGHEAIIATDGQDALNKLHDGLRPSVILLDVVMPKKTGFEVLEEIKKDPKLNKIPVIMASNLGQDEDIKKGLKAGAVDYIVKANTSIEDLIGKIEKYL